MLKKKANGCAFTKGDCVICLSHKNIFVSGQFQEVILLHETAQEWMMYLTQSHCKWNVVLNSRGM